MFERMSKPVKVILAVIGSLIVLASVGYYALGSYANSENAAADPPLSQQSEGAVAAQSAPPIDGRWKATDDSSAGYRVHEVLNGKDVTVVGRTGDLRATVTASGGKIRNATMSVDLASVSTNSKARDSYFRSEIVEVDKHPRATFALTRPVAVTGIATQTGKTTVKAHGTLHINGKHHRVTADLRVVRKPSTVIVSGSLPVTWTDYDVPPPNLGFVQVRDKGRIEFRIAFTKS